MAEAPQTGFIPDVQISKLTKYFLKIDLKTDFLKITQSENYSFVTSFDKISSNNDKIYIKKCSNFLSVSKSSQKNCMVGKKK